MAAGFTQLVSEVIAQCGGKTEEEPDPAILGSQPTSDIVWFSSPSLFHNSSPCAIFTFPAQQTVLHLRIVLCALDNQQYSPLLIGMFNQEAVGCWQVVTSIRQTRVLVVCSMLVIRSTDDVATVMQWLENVARYCRVCMIEKPIIEWFTQIRELKAREWKGSMGVIDSEVECLFAFTDLQPSIDLLLRLKLREIAPHQVCMRLVITSDNECSKSSQSQSFRQIRTWRSALKASIKPRDDFCTLSPVLADGQLPPTDVQVTVDALCDFTNCAIEEFVVAVARYPLQKLAALFDVPRLTEQVEPVEVGVYGDSQCDSSRERSELLFEATDYSPPDSLKAAFFKTTAVQHLWGPLLKADISGWTKVYKSRPLDLTKAETFAMDLYNKGLYFKVFPWRSTYCTQQFEYCLAPRFHTRDLLSEKPTEAAYRQALQESWLQYVEKKRRVTEILPLHIFDPSVFKIKPINSSVLGKGGFGIVYHNILGSERVAIKATNPNRQYSLNQINSELEILSTMKHPNIVNVIGLTTFEDKRLIVLERCEFSLSAYIKQQNSRRKEKNMEQDLTMLIKIAKALEFLHKKDICHFDIKPSNILLSLANGEFEAKLSDFGMASRRRVDGTWKKPGYTIGYSSPEQLQGCKIGTHCDVWAFSMIAYFLLFCKPPYGDIPAPEDKSEKKQRFLEEVCYKRRKPKLDAEFERTHSKLAYLLRQCWHSDPHCRPRMSEVVKKLEKIKEYVKKDEPDVKDHQL